MVGFGTYQERGCSRRRIHPLLNRETLPDWRGNRGVGGEKTVFTSRAVLRRPSVRTRTSTTPVRMGLGGIRGVGGEKSVFTSRAVLRRPSVRTGTSTTPVRMGLVRIRGVVAWKNRFFPSCGLPHAESDATELSEVTESYVMKSVFTRRANLIRTTKYVCFLGGPCFAGRLCGRGRPQPQ